jgi:PAS domain S-box-containing protein
MGDLVKPRAQLVEELNELRGKIETLRTLEAEHKQTELSLQGIFHELRVHQEELQTQNEQLRTTRRELESSQRKYRFLFDFAPIGYFIIHNDTRIKEVNLSGADMLGYERRYIIGKPLLLRVASASRNKLGSHFRKVFEGTDDSVEVNFLHQSESEFPVVLQSKLIRERLDMAPSCLTAALDIPGRKKAEIALQAANRRL